jgi:hypothetical protein
MNEEIISCGCGYKGVKSVLYKTAGKCPKCAKVLSKAIQADMVA